MKTSKKSNQSTRFYEKITSIKPSLYYVGFALSIFMYGIALASDVVTFYPPDIVINILNISAVLASLLLLKMHVIGFRGAFAFIGYILIAGQNFLLIYTILTGSRSYEAILFFAAFDDLIGLFATGIIMPRIATTITGLLTASVLCLGGFLAPKESTHEFAILLPLVLVCAIVLFTMYRNLVERLLSMLSGARASLATKHRSLRAAQKSMIVQEKLSALGEVVAGIAHEIKNPLNFVVNYSEESAERFGKLIRLLDPVKQNLKDETLRKVEKFTMDISENLEAIRKYGVRADHIIQSMLMHTRQGSEAFAVENVVPIVEECMTISYQSKKMSSPGFSCKTNLEIDKNIPAIPIIRGDIVRVLFNLLSNAFYSMESKKRTAGDAFDPQLDVHVATDVDKVRISIRDNGVGINDQIQPKIFLPFYTTKPPGEGTGLGLSLSREIIETEHRGTLTVESKEMEFASFTISLPTK